MLRKNHCYSLGVYDDPQEILQGQAVIRVPPDISGRRQSQPIMSRCWGSGSLLGAWERRGAHSQYICWELWLSSVIPPCQEMDKHGIGALTWVICDNYVLPSSVSRRQPSARQATYSGSSMTSPSLAVVRCSHVTDAILEECNTPQINPTTRAQLPEHDQDYIIITNW